MLKNFFLAAIVGLIIFAGGLAEAEEIYVGNSFATGHDLYLLTDTISRDYEHKMVIYSATIKTLDSFDNEYFIDYKFFDLDDDGEDVRFTNSEGTRGLVDEYDTPIEWKMFRIVRDY